MALVGSIPQLHGAPFTLIEPHQKVADHRDPFAGPVRYHLGLITPNHDDCRTFVDGAHRSWRDGQSPGRASRADDPGSWQPLTAASRIG